MTKKILVIAILAIAGIGLFMLNGPVTASTLSSTPTSTQEVTITTDRLEYKRGESIRITVRNGLDKSVWYVKATCPPSCCYLFRWENNEWRNLGGPMPCIQLVPPPTGGPYFMEPDELKPEGSTSKQWDMMMGGKLAGSGKYRFSFYYGLSKDNYTEKTIYSNEFTVKEKKEAAVIITTDKSEYERGEIIEITVNNKLNTPILYYAGGDERFWGIEYLADGKWKNPDYERGGGFQLTEKNINDTCYIRLYERMPPIEIKVNSMLPQQWNQRICPFGEEEPGKPRFVKYIEAGCYRLIFYYGFEISREDPYKITDEKTVYSNEFTIK